VNAGAEIIAWIVIGAVAGWLASRIIGADAQRGARTDVVTGVIAALVGGFITRAVLAHLGFENIAVAASAGALFGTCAMVFGWHGFSYGKVDEPRASNALDRRQRGGRMIRNQNHGQTLSRRRV
jgi:uncharacterized membrane protein YeaQ/YmgE (transglycosylase-associated protein family)